MYLSFFVLVSCFDLYSQEPNFIFTFQVNGLKSGSYPITVHLVTELNGNSIILLDTLTAEKNFVEVKGIIQEECLIYFQVKKSGMFDCAIGPGDSAFLTVNSGQFGENFQITGSRRPVVMANYLFNYFVKQSEILNKQKQLVDSLIINKANNRIIANAKEQLDSLNYAYYIFNIHFADTTPSAVSASFALTRYLDGSSAFDIFPYVEKAINRFGSIVTMKALEKSYFASKKTSTAFGPGDTLKFLNLFNSVYRKTYFKNIHNRKLLLIDFWASWCLPCKEEFSFMNEAYRQFKDKGFEIISISLDENKEAWEKSWFSAGNLWLFNYWDIRGWQSPTVKQLNIRSIPRNYLIDAKGRIYAKDLRGTELIETLRRYL